MKKRIPVCGQHIEGRLMRQTQGNTGGCVRACVRACMRACTV